MQENRQAAAIEHLICEMLRGPHVRDMGHRELADYAYQVGVVLHNTPHLLTGAALNLEQLRDIDRLDPNGGKQSHWGPWATDFASAFDLPMPRTPVSA